MQWRSWEERRRPRSRRPRGRSQRPAARSREGRRREGGRREEGRHEEGRREERRREERRREELGCAGGRRDKIGYEKSRADNHRREEIDRGRNREEAACRRSRSPPRRSRWETDKQADATFEKLDRLKRLSDEGSISVSVFEKMQENIVDEEISKK